MVRDESAMVGQGVRIGLIRGNRPAVDGQFGFVLTLPDAALS